MTFFSCLFLLAKYLLVIAVIGFILGRFVPIANFVPTAIGYFFISFLFLVISGPLYLTRNNFV